MKSQTSCSSELIVQGALVGAALILGGTVLGFAWLRETTIFWQNAGGYPVWLRDVVRSGFYPLVVGDGLVLIVLSRRLIARPLAYPKTWLAELGLTLLLWCVLGTSAAVVVANNLTNLMEGRPLHQHAEESP